MDDMLAAFARHVRARPDDIAIFEGDDALTFCGFDAAIDRMAHLLVASGLGPGAIVGWLGGTGISRQIFVAATQKAGMAFAAPDMQAPEPMMGAMLREVGTAGLVAEEGFRALARRIGWPEAIPFPTGPAARAETPPFAPAPANPDAVALVRFTSGSTGMPKGVGHTRRGAGHWARLAVDTYGLTERNTLALLDQFWPETVLAPLISGSRIGCFDFRAGGPAALADWVNAEGINVLAVFAAQFRQLAATGRTLKPVRHLLFSGEAMSAADIAAFERMTGPGAVLQNNYAAAECPFMIACFHEHGAPMSLPAVPLGRPIEDGAIRLIDENGAEAVDGEVGEIRMASPYLPVGYLNDPAQTARVFGLTEDCVRTYRTGDLAYRDLSGVYHAMGRRDEQIKIRGYRVRPVEIEPLIRALPGVGEAAVVAIEGAGARGVRRLVCHYTGVAEAADLQRQLATQLPNYMVPPLWRRHEALPKTGSGKIRRAALAAMAVEDGQRAEGAFSGDAERRVAEVMAGILGVGAVAAGDDFFDLGGDSLMAMSLTLELEKRFGRRVPLEALVLEGATPASVAGMLAGAGADDGVTVLRAGDGRAPILVMHGIGGDFSDYVEIIHDLDRGRPVIGVRAGGLSGARADNSFQAMARHTLAGLEQTLESGPPAAILGYSFGCFVGLELARELGRRGQTVPPLVLLDPEVRFRGLRNHLGRLRAMIRGPLGLRRGKIEDAHGVAAKRYRPRALPVDRALIVLTPANDREEVRAYWTRRLGAGVRFETVDCHHLELRHAPNSRLVARLISDWLA